jgi:hypothetical protein
LGAQPAQLAQELQIVLQGFPKSEPRINHYAVGGNTRRAAHLNALIQERFDLVHDIHIVGSQLHAPRVSLHVHDAHSARGGGRDLDGPLLAQSSYIVYEPRTGFRRCTHYLRLAGIDRYDGIGLSPQFLDDGHNAADFLFHAYWVGARSRGLSAHVNDRRTFLDHAQAMAHSSSDIAKLPAIGK